MSKLHNLLLAAVMASASLGACAQTTEAEHAQHHPGAAASAPMAVQPAVQPPGPRPAMNPEQTAAMDKHMTAMQETHQKMMSARTPEERQGAMAEHMKLMHDGAMPMMKMGGDAKGMQCGMGNNAMLEQRMAHMESMMQTMMERLPAAPARKR